MEAIDKYRHHIDTLRDVLTGASGVSEASLRAAVLARAGGGAPVDEPYDGLAQQIAEAAHRVTDAQVAAVRAAVGSDKATFEIIMAASIGAGLARWETALRVIDEASDAPA